MYAVDGDLSNNHEALREELSNMTVDLPYGPVSLDENRHGIVDVYLSRLQLEGDQLAQNTVALIPQVDQTFGGTFSTETPGPSREFPECNPGEADLPWLGNAIPVVDGVPQE